MVLVILVLVLFSFIAVYALYSKNSQSKAAVNDETSPEFIKREVAALMDEFKKLYEKNAQLTKENDALKAKITKIEGK